MQSLIRIGDAQLILMSFLLEQLLQLKEVIHSHLSTRFNRSTLRFPLRDLTGSLRFLRNSCNRGFTNDYILPDRLSPPLSIDFLLLLEYLNSVVVVTTVLGD